MLLVSDKSYGLRAGVVTCSVNYNAFFIPLQRRFAEVHVLGPVDLVEDDLPFAMDGFQFHGVPPYRSYGQYFLRYVLKRQSRTAYAVIEAAVARVDIVFLALNCYFAPAVVKACRRSGTPLVLEVLDDVVGAVEDTNKYGGLQRFLALRVARHLEHYYIGLCRQHYSLILGRALWERYASEDTVAPRLEFFETHMELADYEFASREPFPRPVRLLYVGRIVPMKAVDTLVRAVATLRQRHIPCTCDIIGYGESEPEIRALVAALDLGNSIQMRGFVPYGPDLFRYYDNADFCVVTSVAGEGVPRVLLEAMGRGCIPIGTRVCGIPSIITSGINGYLVAPGDADDIACRVEGYIRNRAECDVLRGQAKAFMLEHTRTAQIERLLEFVHPLLLGPGAADAVGGPAR